MDVTQDVSIVDKNLALPIRTISMNPPADADPAAAVLSVSIMLEHLGHPEAARRVEQAVAAELSARTAGAPLRTEEVGDRLASSVA